MIQNFLDNIKKIVDEKDLNFAIQRWGHKSREDMAMEECAELILAIMHKNRRNKPGTNAEILEEGCDAIMCILNLFESIGVDPSEILEKKYNKFLDTLYKRDM